MKKFILWIGMLLFLGVTVSGTDSTLATYYFASLGINLVLIFLLVYGIVAYRKGRW